MILKLDPRFPLVWRTPSSLQLGVDPSLVRLDEVTELQERLLAALTLGVSAPGLTMIARGDRGELDALLLAVAPALAEPDGTAEPSTIALTGDGPLVDALAAALAGSGVHVELGTAAADLGDPRPDLAILVHHFVVPPDLHGLWLRRDVAHLPIVFSDGGVSVGPIVEPGAGPCLLCLELHRRDADDSWPAIATQLLGRRAAAETPTLVLEAAAHACRLVLDRLAGGPGPAVSVRIDAATGRREETAWQPHPECGCRGIELVLVGSSNSAHPHPDGGGSRRLRD
jgi:bacteriocin biosynthesis cyclodehydratase domain-containing protein